MPIFIHPDGIQTNALLFRFKGLWGLLNPENVRLKLGIKMDTWIQSYQRSKHLLQYE
jgi:hypothetical protein